MHYDLTLINYFLGAGIVVKTVMILLVFASIFSWAYIMQRIVYLRKMHQLALQFEKNYESYDDLSELYRSGRHHTAGLESLFHAGFKEYLRFRKLPEANIDMVVENAKRAMRAQQLKQLDALEAKLPFLAMVGSTSPYVGLFGTVWGIMQALSALANQQQATIAMVAPGMAEALIATALGLFAAIPAVIAYNRFVTDINRLMNRYDAFQEELINTLIRDHQPLVTQMMAS